MFNGNASAKGQGFENNPQNIRKGIKKGYVGNMTIRAQLKKALKSSGEIRIRKRDIISIEKNGDVLIRITQANTLVLKLLAIAQSKNEKNALKAIQTIIDNTEGKLVDIVQPATIESLTDKELQAENNKLIKLITGKVVK